MTQVEKITYDSNKAQINFSAKYISSAEICKRLNVSRSTVVYARKCGLLPEPIQLNDFNYYLWEREQLEPFLTAWAYTLQIRRRA